MQNIKKYRICDLIKTTKNIKIINSYDNRVLYNGKQENIPAVYNGFATSIVTEFPVGRYSMAPVLKA